MTMRFGIPGLPKVRKERLITMENQSKYPYYQLDQVDAEDEKEHALLYEGI